MKPFPANVIVSMIGFLFLSGFQIASADAFVGAHKEHSTDDITDSIKAFFGIGDQGHRTISGMVLEDTDDDGSGDDPLRGVFIELYTSDGNLVSTVTTDLNGGFLFSVTPGVYTLREVTPAGFVDVDDSDGGDPNLIEGIDVTSADSFTHHFIDKLPVFKHVVISQNLKRDLQSYSTYNPPTKPPTYTSPTKNPTKNPTKTPTNTSPTNYPTKAPTKPPTKAPTRAPTWAPTWAPTKPPTTSPTKAPTKPPTKVPTKTPTYPPTQPPTKYPTKAPTYPPTQPPTKTPTKAPTYPPTQPPTKTPTKAPTYPPTQPPTKYPTKAPTYPPTQPPTKVPTKTPTYPPTQPPTKVPTKTPTYPPTQPPTKVPTKAPTWAPTKPPTTSPTKAPTKPPTKVPTKTPTYPPTQPPTKIPTKTPTYPPTQPPTKVPTKTPTYPPTKPPTKTPTYPPTEPPTKTPTYPPTKPPTTSPTKTPTYPPTKPPTTSPTNAPTAPPSKTPTKTPTYPPTQPPTKTPTKTPTDPPTEAPTAIPTLQPSQIPTSEPTPRPTSIPTADPTAVPTEEPTARPTASPTPRPTSVPTALPTAVPTEEPTANPTPSPTPRPTPVPTALPTAAPTDEPTEIPTRSPTFQPTRDPTPEPTSTPTAKPTPNPTSAPTALGSIAGTVLEDINHDGTGNTPIAGVTITLLDKDGKTVAVTVTDSSGNFAFIDLPAGVFTLVQTNLPGYSDVSDTGGNPLDNRITVTLTSGGSSPDNNFVDKRFGSIAGNVKEDLNNDNIGDESLVGVNVTLLDSAGSVVGSMLTGAAGNYKFVDLPPGSYTVVETNLAGYSDVSDTEGNPLDNEIEVDLSVGVNSTGNNFVDERLGSIAGKVEEDTDNDNVGDKALAGVNVTLLDGAGKIVSSMLTGPMGKYKFIDLPAGNYKVIETNLDGYIDVSDTQGNPLDNTIAVILAVGDASVENNFVDEIPTTAPTQNPTAGPTAAPTAVPTAIPTKSPTTAAPTTMMPSVRECVFDDNAANFAFVIDGSESILDKDFKKIRNITAKLISAIQAKSPRSTFSIVTYSNDVETTLPTNQDADSILPTIPNLVHLKGGTDTEAGLRAGQATFLDNGLPHTIILLTDGNPVVKGIDAEVAAEGTTVAADEIKATGTFIVPIGVLNAVSLSVASSLTANLNLWATTPRFVQTPEDYDDLLSIIDEIIGEIECI